MNRLLTIGVLGGAALLSGCAGLSDQQQRAMTGTAIGAGSGAVIGAMAGSTTTGALIGAGAGLAGGLIVDYNKRQQQQAFDRGVQAGRQQSQQR